VKGSQQDSWEEGLSEKLGRPADKSETIAAIERRAEQDQQAAQAIDT